jgi:hypothetical protein
MADRRSKRVQDVEKATNEALARYRQMSSKPVDSGPDVRIGFGMAPTYTTNRIVKEVVIDANTAPNAVKAEDKSALYTLGWSLNEEP